MRIAIASFTRNGCAINRRLMAELSKNAANTESLEDGALQCRGFGIEKYRGEYGLEAIAPSLREWTKRMFSEADALVYICAAGIAVRSIAPYVKSKKTDPAVVVVDEQGKFAISLLSGHIGGANALTEQIAGILHAIPVITTATDLSGKFAVDVFAVKNGCYIGEMILAKEIASELVDGKSVGFACDYPVSGTLPAELIWRDDRETPQSRYGIYIGMSGTKQVFARTLHLIPPVVTVGIGCKRSTPVEKIEKLLKQVLREADISIHAIYQAASISLKAKEPGIIELCSRYGWKFQTYSDEELRQVPGNFTASSFVQRATGVDNVCERSAVKAGGTLIRKKTAADGVTIALAVREWRATV